MKESRISISSAIIIAGLIVAVGTFATNTLHDLKENHDQAVLRDQAADCRHWEEGARVVGHAAAEHYRMELGANSPDKRTNAEYWVSVDKVQRWYPREALDENSGKVNRPSFC